MARLENWSYRVKAGIYDAPETFTTHLVGTVYGHQNPQRHPDGKRIVTSRLVSIEGDLVVTKSGSKFELGEADPDYEKEFPNAKQRLLDRLRKK
jgi:hypothetical protein